MKITRAISDNFILNGNFFTENVKNQIQNDGFEICRNESHCAFSNNLSSSDGYHKIVGRTGSDNRPINAFIFREGIGVDIDYNSGENYLSVFWGFENHKDFDEAYARMNYFINDYLAPQHSNETVWY